MRGSFNTKISEGLTKSLPRSSFSSTNVIWTFGHLGALLEWLRENGEMWNLPSCNQIKIEKEIKQPDWSSWSINNQLTIYPSSFETCTQTGHKINVNHIIFVNCTLKLPIFVILISLKNCTRDVRVNFNDPSFLLILVVYSIPHWIFF